MARLSAARVHRPRPIRVQSAHLSDRSTTLRSAQRTAIRPFGRGVRGIGRSPAARSHSATLAPCSAAALQRARLGRTNGQLEYSDWFASPLQLGQDPRSCGSDTPFTSTPAVSPFRAATTSMPCSVVAVLATDTMRQPTVTSGLRKDDRPHPNASSPPVGEPGFARSRRRGYTTWNSIR